MNCGRRPPPSCLPLPYLSVRAPGCDRGRSSWEEAPCPRACTTQNTPPHPPLTTAPPSSNFFAQLFSHQHSPHLPSLNCLVCCPPLPRLLRNAPPPPLHTTNGNARCRPAAGLRKLWRSPPPPPSWLDPPQPSLSPRAPLASGSAPVPTHALNTARSPLEERGAPAAALGRGSPSSLGVCWGPRCTTTTTATLASVFCLLCAPSVPPPPAPPSFLSHHAPILPSLKPSPSLLVSSVVCLCVLCAVKCSTKTTGDASPPPSRLFQPSPFRRRLSADRTLPPFGRRGETTPALFVPPPSPPPCAFF